MEADSLQRVSHLYAMAWAMCHVSLGYYLKNFFLSIWEAILRVSLWKKKQSFWENMFKVKLKNGSNLFCTEKKILFELFFHFSPLTPKLGYRFLTTKFRFLRHHFPVFYRVDQLSGSWNILFQELKRKFLDYEIL